MLGPWEDDLTPLWALDWTQFRVNVSDAMVGMYFNRYTQQCQFVGKSETAADSLVAALRQAGEEFDETALRDTPRVNESPKDGDLASEALWKFKRDQLGQLPDDMVSRLPVDLLPKLPPGRLEQLPSPMLAAVARRVTIAALQSAGAAARPGGP